MWTNYNGNTKKRKKNLPEKLLCLTIGYILWEELLQPETWNLVIFWVHLIISITWSSLCRWAFSIYSVDYILQAGDDRTTSENSWKKHVSMPLILTCLDSSHWLSHTSLFLPFSLSWYVLLLSLSLPRWHVDSSLSVGISFQRADWEGLRDVVIISISGCLAAFPSACWQTLAIEQLSGRKGVGCGLKLHRSRSFLSKSHWS